METQSIGSCTSSGGRPYVANDYIREWNASIRKVPIVEHVIQEIYIAMSNRSLSTLLGNHIVRHDINNEAVPIVEHACKDGNFP